jgi:hypothetical protein
MIQSTLVRATEVQVGDTITEQDTPEGPFYAVAKVNAKSLLVEVDGFTLRLPVRGSDVVRRAV